MFDVDVVWAGGRPAMTVHINRGGNLNPHIKSVRVGINDFIGLPLQCGASGCFGQQ